MEIETQIYSNSALLRCTIMKIKCIIMPKIQELELGRKKGFNIQVSGFRLLKIRAMGKIEVLV